MAQYRTQTRIIADVPDRGPGRRITAGDGVGITTLLRRGNLSYTRLAKLVSDLVGSGLLIEVNKNSGGAEAYSRYKNQRKGYQVLVRLQGIRRLRSILRTAAMIHIRPSSFLNHFLRTILTNHSEMTLAIRLAVHFLKPEQIESGQTQTM